MIRVTDLLTLSRSKKMKNRIEGNTSFPSQHSMPSVAKLPGVGGPLEVNIMK